MQPSRPGYNFTVADLLNFDISPLEAAKIMVAASGGAPANLSGDAAAGLQVDPIVALLAGILKSQKRSNAQYGPFAWQLTLWSQIQVLTQNAVRSYLLIQNVGSGDLMVLFEGGPSSVQDMSSAAGQNELTVKQTRAIRVVAGGNYEPLMPPSNAITIFTIGVATQGVCIEGA